ncbi:DUF2530 domain-containing protein [Pedococcus sp. 5OH_020]|uniref:DUF2530 domain-containing protein n=1 Tax=Pedococcus sp. 5OH_020 TaxID=2989814 RepID=UPI0022E9D154|nr:DUF2530 domain-containing protein [Pedococcus sp. 5OH_020]
MSESQPVTGASPGTADELQPLAVSSVTIVRWGLVAWGLALVLTLALPVLHSGQRSWWPWTCVAGLAIGLLGYAYVRRGRGNAEGA